jgi:hypothetical protein
MSPPPSMPISLPQVSTYRSFESILFVIVFVVRRKPPLQPN